MSPAAIALFVLCAALIGFLCLVAWGLGSAAAEDLERSRRRGRSD
ncbi:MAG TPA: hypothetical protein VFY99_01690 [Solirubrobacterales bacterium]